LSDFLGRLIWLPGTVHSKFINCFIFFIVLFFISKMDFEVEVAVEAFDCLVNIVLANMDFLGMGMNFRPKPSMVAVAVGMDLQEVKSWNCLFVKWEK
jgi:hypothetical protein